MIEAIYRLFLGRFPGLGGVGGKGVSVLLSIEAPANACLPFADGVSTEGDASMAGCEDGDKGGVRKVGVPSGGRESGLWTCSSLVTAGVVELFPRSGGARTLTA